MNIFFFFPLILRINFIVDKVNEFEELSCFGSSTGLGGWHDFELLSHIRSLYFYVNACFTAAQEQEVGFWERRRGMIKD